MKCKTCSFECETLKEMRIHYLREHGGRRERLKDQKPLIIQQKQPIIEDFDKVIDENIKKDYQRARMVYMTKAYLHSDSISPPRQELNPMELIKAVTSAQREGAENMLDIQETLKAQMEEREVPQETQEGVMGLIQAVLSNPDALPKLIEIAKPFLQKFISGERQ